MYNVQEAVSLCNTRLKNPSKYLEDFVANIICQLIAAQWDTGLSQIMGSVSEVYAAEHTRACWYCVE